MQVNKELHVYDNLLDLVGNTPLLELKKITKGLKGRYFAKIEAFNAGQSAKDRIAKYIVEQAEKKGILKPGSTIVETSLEGRSLKLKGTRLWFSCLRVLQG